MRDIRDQPVMLCEPSKKIAASVEGVLDGLMQRGDYWWDLKFDGIRALAYVTDGQVKLVNRVERDVTFRYPEIVAAFAQAYPRGSMVFDGEIVCFGPDGKPDFARAHKRDAQSGATAAASLVATAPATFMAFDLLWHLGHDLRAIPYTVRRQLLQAEATTSFKSTDALQWSRSEKDGHTMWKFIVDNGMEGLIAKRGGSTYKAGRSPDWIKLKSVFSISVIATASTQGSGKRASTFGSLTMTLLDGTTPVNIGEVGTGFNDKQLVEIKQRMDAGELLVLEVELTGIFKETGKARFPSFKYVRTDCGPLDCTIDQLAAVPTI